MTGNCAWTCRIILTLLISLLTGLSSEIRGDDSPAQLPYNEALEKDKAVWSELFRKGDYSALEKIGDELRTQNSKYCNGRGRLWRFASLALSAKPREMKDEEYTESIKRLEDWLKAKPKSISARLVMAQLWIKFAMNAGSAPAGQTDPSKVHAERHAQAKKHLDAIATLTKKVDNTYRRLRLELTKGQGEKPDVNLVYDGLKDDPACLELVHGMAVCLVPRWYGAPGELEKFADEVVRRTKDQCGELQYAIVAIATKELLKSCLLDTHEFSWPRLQQGFRDWERLYPNCSEHLNDEAQLAFMAGDLPALYALVAKIGDRADAASWKEAEISYADLRQRMTPEMLAGDQKQLLLGHADAIMAVETVDEGNVAVSVNWNFLIRMHDTATGKRRGWTWIRGVHGESISIHPLTGLFASGSEYDPGIMLQNLGNGESGRLAPSKAKIKRTAFSPKGDLLAAADAQGLVVVYDLQTGKLTNKFAPNGKREVTRLAFSSKANKLAATCVSGDLLIFDLGAEKLEATHKIAGQNLRSVAWSDPHVAVGTAAGQVHVLNATTGAEVSTWKAESLSVGALAFSPDGEKLAIGIRAKNWNTPVKDPLLVWNFRSDKTPQSLKGHQLSVNSVRFIGSGKQLISASSDWTVRTWNTP